jgi:hypothetical protein
LGTLKRNLAAVWPDDVRDIINHARDPIIFFDISSAPSLEALLNKENIEQSAPMFATF